MAGTLEVPSVLPADADLPACFKQLVHAASRLFQIPGAVEEKHIGCFRHGGPDTREMPVDITDGILRISSEDSGQRPDPVFPGGAVGAHQCMHGQDVHFIVMDIVFIAAQPVAQEGIRNDVIASDQSGQVKGFARGVSGENMTLCPFIDQQERNVLLLSEDDVAPDFIADYITFITLKDLKSLLQLPALPHPSGRIVGRAEDNQMNPVLFYFALHILKIHAPHAVFIGQQRAVDGFSAGSLNVGSVSHVDRGMQKNLVAGRGQDLNRAGHHPVNTVFIADVFPFQAGKMVAPFMPGNNRIIICVAGRVIAEQGMLHTADYGVCDSGRRRKIHVGDPHGNEVEPFFRASGFETPAAAASENCVNRICIFSKPVGVGCKIITHNRIASIFWCVTIRKASDSGDRQFRRLIPPGHRLRKPMIPGKP